MIKVAVTREETLKAVETIQTFCDEFDSNFAQIMASLPVDKVEAFCDDRRQIGNIKGQIGNIRTWMERLSVKVE